MKIMAEIKYCVHVIQGNVPLRALQNLVNAFFPRTADEAIREKERLIKTYSLNEKDVSIRLVMRAR